MKNVIVNFSAPGKLIKKIDRVIKNKGFSNRAEFFRYLAIDYLDELEDGVFDNDEEMGRLTKEIEELVTKKFKGKKIPSSEEQLKDI